MDSKFLMGMNDALTRTSISKNEHTFLDEELKRNLQKVAIKEACKFYQQFFNEAPLSQTLDELVDRYRNDFQKANSYGLFKSGGIREKDHINFWCLSEVFRLEKYIESGVYFGSSLHAFTRNEQLDSIVAIDPDLSKLKVPKSELKNANYIDNQDFSELLISGISNRTLVYFDDHINSAARIIQCHNKGIKYVLFDDSTGLEGVSQRLYPAVPTIPMILNYKEFPLGSKMSWTWNTPIRKRFGRKELLKALLKKTELKRIRVEMTVDQDLIDQCAAAEALVVKCQKIPCLGDYIVPRQPEKMVDTAKYLLELNVEKD